MDINERIEQLEKELEMLKADVKKENNTWEPDKEENYFIIESDGRISECTNSYQSVTNNHLAIGNVFKTRRDAEFAVERLKVKQELREYAETFDPDKTQCTMIYFHGDKTIYKTSTRAVVYQGSFYFDSIETIEKAISEIGEDRIKKYIFGIEDD